jgi:hypothetical protein
MNEQAKCIGGYAGLELQAIYPIAWKTGGHK